MTFERGIAPPDEDPGSITEGFACTNHYNWAGGPRVTGDQGPLVVDVYMFDIRVITPPLLHDNDTPLALPVYAPSHAGTERTGLSCTLPIRLSTFQHFFFVVFRFRHSFFESWNHSFGRSCILNSICTYRRDSLNGNKKIHRVDVYF